MAPSRDAHRPAWQRLALAAAAAGTATCATHGVDTCKARVQLERRRPGAAAPSLLGVARGMLRHEPAALLRGLGPALWRNATYSATRLGAYEPVQGMFAAAFTVDMGARGGDGGGRWRQFAVKMAAGTTSGALGALVGNPFELAKVRMQAVGGGGGGSGGGTGFTVVLRQVVAEEGVRGLYRGLAPSMVRSALLTSSQLVGYDAAKQVLLSAFALQPGDPAAHVGAGLMSGILVTTVCNPADCVKTRVMAARAAGGGGGVCGAGELMRITREVVAEGALMRGWLGNYARLGPHVLITMVVYERLRRAVGWEPL